MNDIDHTISILAQKSDEILKTLAHRARRHLRTNPDDAKWQRLLLAIDREQGKRIKPRRISTGSLAWDPHDAGQVRFHGYVGEDVHVATVFQRANHTSDDKEVYRLEVLGTAVGAGFQRISEAREAGERAYADRVGGAPQKS